MRGPGGGLTLFQAGWALDSSSWHIWCQSRSSALAFSVGLKRIRPASKAQRQAHALLARAAGGCCFGTQGATSAVACLLSETGPAKPFTSMSKAAEWNSQAELPPWRP